MIEDMMARQLVALYHEFRQDYVRAGITTTVQFLPCKLSTNNSLKDGAHDLF